MGSGSKNSGERLHGADFIVIDDGEFTERLFTIRQLRVFEERTCWEASRFPGLLHR